MFMDQKSESYQNAGSPHFIVDAGIVVCSSFREAEAQE